MKLDESPKFGVFGILNFLIYRVISPDKFYVSTIIPDNE
jgi:hypothetical protein